MRPRSGFDALEASLLRTSHPYFAVKQLIESELLDESSKGTPIVIVNPTMCLGPWDLRDRAFCFMPRLVKGELPVAMSHILNIIDVREVATGIAAALDADRYGEPILLSGHNVSTEALFARICEIGGRSPAPRVYVPAAAAMLSSYWAEVALGIVGQSTPLPFLAPVYPMLEIASRAEVLSFFCIGHTAEHLGEVHLELGDPSLAGHAAQQALVNDPCRESAHRLLMRCYASRHQQQLVSRQYRTCSHSRHVFPSHLH